MSKKYLLTSITIIIAILLSWFFNKGLAIWTSYSYEIILIRHTIVALLAGVAVTYFSQIKSSIPAIIVGLTLSMVVFYTNQIGLNYYTYDLSIIKIVDLFIFTPFAFLGYWIVSKIKQTPKSVETVSPKVENAPPAILKMEAPRNEASKVSSIPELNELYYLHDGKEPFGPLQLSEMQKMQLRNGWKVRKSVNEEWRPITQILSLENLKDVAKIDEGNLPAIEPLVESIAPNRTAVEENLADDESAEVYYLHNGKEKIGPLTLTQIKEVHPEKDWHVWKQGFADWVIITDLSEFDELLISVPPPFNPSNEPINEPVNSNTEYSNHQAAVEQQQITDDEEVKKGLKWWAVIVLLIIAGFTNPSVEKHRHAVALKIAERFHSGLGTKGLMGMLANSDATVGASIEYLSEVLSASVVTRTNYFLFSTTEWYDNTNGNKTLGIGLFGVVFITEELSFLPTQ